MFLLFSLPVKNGSYKRFENFKVVGNFIMYWPEFFNSIIAEIVLDKYSRLEPLGFEGMIGFEVLVVEKFEFEHSAIFCVPVGKRFRSVTSGTRFVHTIELPFFLRLASTSLLAYI